MVGQLAWVLHLLVVFHYTVTCQSMESILERQDGNVILL